MLEWIVTSSILILAVCILRYALKNHISARLRYGLWLLVLVRLLVPLSIPSGSSVMNAVPRPQALETPITYIGSAPSQQMPEQVPQLPTVQQLPQHEQAAGEYQTAPGAEPAPTGTPITLKSVLVCLWILGMLCVLTLFLVGNVRFARLLRKARIPLPQPTCALPVYLCPGLDTPCLYGFPRPAIYVTQDLAPDSLNHILAHEQTHFAHKDHIFCLLRSLCLVLHWYNPLVWLAAIVSKRDMELACDEGTVLRLGEDARVAYGKTLIDMTCVKRNATDLFTASTTMAAAASTLKERIITIARHPKTRKITLVCVVLALAVIAGCTFTGSLDAGSQGSQADAAQATYADMIRCQGQYYRFRQYLSGPVSALDTQTEHYGVICQYVENWQLPEGELSSNRFQPDTPVYIPVTLLEDGSEAPSAPLELYVEENGKTYIYAPITDLEAQKALLTMDRLRTLLDSGSYNWETFRAFSGKDVSFEDYIYEYPIADTDYILKVRSHLATKVDSLLLIHTPSQMQTELLEEDLEAFLNATKSSAPQPMYSKASQANLLDSVDLTVQSLSLLPHAQPFKTGHAAILYEDHNRNYYSSCDAYLALSRDGQVIRTELGLVPEDAPAYLSFHDLTGDGQDEIFVCILGCLDSYTLCRIYTVEDGTLSVFCDLNEAPPDIRFSYEGFRIVHFSLPDGTYAEMDLTGYYNRESFTSSGVLQYSPDPYYWYLTELPTAEGASLQCRRLVSLDSARICFVNYTLQYDPVSKSMQTVSFEAVPFTETDSAPSLNGKISQLGIICQQIFSVRYIHNMQIFSFINSPELTVYSIRLRAKDGYFSNDPYFEHMDIDSMTDEQILDTFCAFVVEGTDRPSDLVSDPFKSGSVYVYVCCKDRETGQWRDHFMYLLYM